LETLKKQLRIVLTTIMLNYGPLFAFMEKRHFYI
jgi:hypothetical protein